MNKVTVLKILNPVLALIVLTQALTGLLHDLLPAETFELTHKTGGIFLVLGITLHVILNWKWIQANYRSRHSSGK